MYFVLYRTLLEYKYKYKYSRLDGVLLLHSPHLQILAYNVLEYSSTTIYTVLYLPVVSSSVLQYHATVVRYSQRMGHFIVQSTYVVFQYSCTYGSTSVIGYCNEMCRT